MADVNTRYIRRVIIESDNGTHMDDLDFNLEFFVYNRTQIIKKSDLIRVVINEEGNYYAVIDSDVLGRGKVLCRANVKDVEPRLKGMVRPVTILSETGIIIGAHCCNSVDTCSCECYDEGYRIRFEAVNDLPEQGRVGVMYGIINDSIGSYADITEQMTYGLTAADSLDLTMNVNTGDKVVILVNADNPDHAMKGNGVGEFVPFDTKVMGANGEYTITVDNALYRIYGEMMLVSGKLTIKL